jgi:uncharacterized membrane protein
VHAIVEAAVLGGSAGLRSMTPVAALAVGGRLGESRALRWTLVAAAAGELIADKLPQTPSRTSPPALAGRLATGAFVGWNAAGVGGAALGAVAAGGAAVAGQRLRGALVARSGWPDPAIAVAEDGLAAGLALVATRG